MSINDPAIDDWKTLRRHAAAPGLTADFVMASSYRRITMPTRFVGKFTRTATLRTSTVRALRGYLVIFSNGDDPIARLTAVGVDQFGMSFHRHTGRWEPMPFVGDLSQQAYTLVATLGPYLQCYDFSDSKSGSDH